MKKPKIRLKGFGGEWTETTLADVGKCFSGIGFPETEQGGKMGIPFYKVSDMNNIGQMFWFYKTIIGQIGQNPQYEYEPNLLNWAKGQRAYAYLAMATTMIGGVANVAHIISETSAQRDIEQYGQQLLIS